MYRSGLSTRSINEVLETLSNQKYVHIDQTNTRRKIEITQTGVDIYDSIETAFTLMQMK